MTISMRQMKMRMAGVIKEKGRKGAETRKEVGTIRKAKRTEMGEKLSRMARAEQDKKIHQRQAGLMNREHNGKEKGRDGGGRREMTRWR